MNVIDVMNRIKSLPGSLVDKGFLQGHDAVFFQLRLRNASEDESNVDEFITLFQKDVASINNWALPYHLPDDYRFFLEFYGGLLIETATHNLIVEGIGPMVEEWYGFLMGDDAYTHPGKDGLLKISELVFKKQPDGTFPRIIFLLDLAGRVQKGSVIGIGPWRDADPDLYAIIGDFASHRRLWKITAPSFTAWLDVVASTHGTLHYAPHHAD